MSLRPSILISLKMPGPVPPYTNLLLKFSSMLLFPPALTIPLHNLLTYHPPPFVNLRNQSCTVSFIFPLSLRLFQMKNFHHHIQIPHGLTHSYCYLLQSHSWLPFLSNGAPPILTPCIFLILFASLLVNVHLVAM